MSDTDTKLTDEQVYAMFRVMIDTFDRMASLIEQLTATMETVTKNLRMLNELAVEKDES